VNHKLLATYLNDHLAAATAGRELVHRAAGSNEGTPLGAFLRELAVEVEADRGTLEELMVRLDVGQDRLKLGAAWLAEKLGRLKLNGQLTGYSPLSRLLELEALSVGVYGKLALWQSLRSVAELEPRLRGTDLEGLTRRAQSQLRRLQRHRVAVAEGALGAVRA
jgi:hypothetical protein